MLNKEILDSIISYEQGELRRQEVLQLFSQLIQTGLVWKLQGHYGRTAQALIEEGLLDENGSIKDLSFGNVEYPESLTE